MEPFQNTQQNPQNFFLESFSKNLAERKKNDTIKPILQSIDQANLTIEQLSVLGELAYFVGLDFCNQEFYNPIVIDRLVERFKALEIGVDVVNSLEAAVKALANDVESQIIPAKASLRDTLESEVIVATPEKRAYMEFRLNVKNIFENSVYPVMYCEEIDRIISAKTLKYNDILKINSLFNEQITINGKSIKTLIKLYKHPIYPTLLNEASKRFDNQKFAVVLFDSILSLSNAYVKFPDMFQLLTDVEYLDKVLSEIVANPIIPEAKLEVQAETPKSIPTETKELLDNEPDLFLKEMFEQALGSSIDTAEKMMQTIDEVGKNNDLVQHVYAFMKKKDAVNRKPFKEIYPTIVVDRMAELLNNKIAQMKEEQRKMTVMLIEPLPEDSLNRIVKLVNATIEALMITDSKNKGYLVSQIVENQITTYKTLQQIVALIEECEIDGSEAKNTYIALVDYLLKYSDAKNVFVESEKLSDVQLQLTFMMACAKFFFGSQKEQ